MKVSWLNQFLDDAPSLSPERGFVYFTIMLLTSGLLFLSVLFCSRIIKAYFQKKKNVLGKEFQKILNKIIINEMMSERRLIPAFEFYIAELRFMSNNAFARQVLINQLLMIKKNLSGSSEQVLVETYNALALYQHSLRNLKNIAWEKRALAVRELAEMRHVESVEKISKFLYSRNETLRQESFMGLVRLEQQPLAFLNDYKGELSVWMQMNIYNYLSKMDSRTLPTFSQWFNSSNNSVREFAIKMAHQFLQTTSLQGLEGLLYDTNAKTVCLAVRALGEMEAYQYRDQIVKLAHHAWNFHSLALSVVKCLGKIAYGEDDIKILSKFLSHPCYDVRFEAVSTLKKLGLPEAKLSEACDPNSAFTLDGIFKHLAEPLLAAHN